MKTTVSVAMCTYNGATFLQQQLYSLAEQTCRPDQIIICDDSSNDQSLAIAEAFSKNSGLNVRIYRNSNNLGYIKNFEQAISYCTKDIIFLCDQDDLWHPDKIKQIIDVFDTEPQVGLVLHDFCLIDDYNQPYPGPIDTYGPNQLTASNLPQEIRENSISVFMQPYPRAWCGCMMAYRRSFNELILPIFPGKGHDDWILKLLAPITETRFIANPLVSYRMHQKNTNRRYLQKHSLKYLLDRFTLKIKMFLKGYNKKNFYSSIIKKLSGSELPILHPDLIKLYNKFI